MYTWLNSYFFFTKLYVSSHQIIFEILSFDFSPLINQIKLILKIIQLRIVGPSLLWF